MGDAEIEVNALSKDRMEEDELLRLAIEESLESQKAREQEKENEEYARAFALSHAEEDQEAIQAALLMKSRTSEASARIQHYDDDDAVEAAIRASLMSREVETSRLQTEHEDTEEAAIQASIMSHVSETSARLQLEQLEDQEIAAAMQDSFVSSKRRRLADQMNAMAIDYIVDRSDGKKTGSWDCPICTFVNLPYASKCSGCEAKAPSHVLTFNPLPQVRFGLEIEIVVPDGHRDGFSLDKIARQMTSLGPEKVEFLGYTHATTRHWKIVTDSSIQGNDTDLCFELVSPVLQGDEGLSQLRSVMDNIRRLGVSTNASCGFHVHIDAEPGSPVSNLEALKSVSRCFVSLENAFDLLVSCAENGSHAQNRRTNRNRYCQSNRIAFGQMSNRQRWNKISSAHSRKQLVKMLNPGYDRYRKLNLTNVTLRDRPSTYEFRHHGGVQDLQEAEAWVRLIVSFCLNATKPNATEKCLLPEGSQVKDEVKALFDLVDCDGLEQMFIVDRKLFLEERNRNVWKCKVCRKSFTNSRSLAQHCQAVGHSP